PFRKKGAKPFQGLFALSVRQLRPVHPLDFDNSDTGVRKGVCLDRLAWLKQQERFLGDPGKRKPDLLGCRISFAPADAWAVSGLRGKDSSSCLLDCDGGSDPKTQEDQEPGEKRLVPQSNMDHEYDQRDTPETNECASGECKRTVFPDIPEQGPSQSVCQQLGN